MLRTVEYLRNNPRIAGIRCLDHTLNLVVMKSFLLIDNVQYFNDPVANIVSKCSKVIEFFSRSTIAVEMLAEEGGRRPGTTCPTR
jgi:hypothetical protein